MPEAIGGDGLLIEAVLRILETLGAESAKVMSDASGIDVSILGMRDVYAEGMIGDLVPVRELMSAAADAEAATGRKMRVSMLVEQRQGGRVNVIVGGSWCRR